MQTILRYPGSKKFLKPVISNWIQTHGLQESTFYEPFCGGASLGLGLLTSGHIKKLVLADKDRTVRALWQCVFSDYGWLQRAIKTREVSLDMWNKIKMSKPITRRENAWKCLYLNRTCFSGISKGGPIGGQTQSSKYKIDCRFNRLTLSKAVKELANHKGSVKVLPTRTWDKTVQHAEKDNNAIIYLDPPYFLKGKLLYNEFFNYSDHQELINYCATLKMPWILSYDLCDEILELCKERSLHITRVAQRSSTAIERITRKEQTELLITSDKFKFPKNLV